MFESVPQGDAIFMKVSSTLKEILLEVTTNAIFEQYSADLFNLIMYSPSLLNHIMQIFTD